MRCSRVNGDMLRGRGRPADGGQKLQSLRDSLDMEPDKISRQLLSAVIENEHVGERG